MVLWLAEHVRQGCNKTTAVAGAGTICRSHGCMEMRGHRARWVLLLTLGLGLAACKQPAPQRASAEQAAVVSVVMPGPAQRTRTLRDADCVRCHTNAARSWAGSLHRRAWTDASFASAREPDPFCRGCHAPQSDPARPPTENAADVGVSCVTCHAPGDATLPPDGVLAAPSGGADGESPHPIVRSPRFASDQACAGCHEFASQRNPRLAMQSTVSEHVASPFAAVSCQSCHMPLEHGERSHGFHASRDPAALRSALHVEATRSESPELTLTMRPGRVGHAFPTGDPFRRLLLEVDEVTSAGLVPIDRRALTRTIETVRRGYFSERVEVADTRVGGKDFEPIQRFALAEARTSPVVWRVVYERLDLPFGRESPRIFDRIILFEGTLEAHP